MSSEQASAARAGKASGTIQALDRGLMVLEALAAVSQDASLSQLAARFPWHKTTTLRLLSTLVQHGHVEQDAESQRYRLGLGILRLSSALGRRLDLRERAVEVVRKLASRTRETAHVAVLDGREAVVLEQVETVERIRINTYVGMRLPCHCTALGKVLLAYVPEEELAPLLEPKNLERFTEQTIVLPARLKAHLAEVRDQGYARDDQEYDPGMSCLAAPVRDRHGRVVASVGISGPSQRLQAQILETAIAAVVEAGRRISERLGYLAQS